jgi:hypothetical protein
VIEVPRNQTKKYDNKYEELVSRIVEATNWQNAIKPSDLRSNDPRQISLERELRKQGFQYLRKRMTKAEARRVIGSQYRMLIKKEDLAKAVADCLSPSLSRLAGKEKLFDEDDYYNMIFAGHSTRFFIACYWLARSVNRAAWGSKDMKWAKLVAQRVLWLDLGEDLEKHATRLASALQNPLASSELEAAMRRTIEPVLTAAVRSYRANRGLGNQTLDIQTYFKQKESYERFERYWESRDSKKYLAARRRLADALRVVPIHTND